MNTSTIELQLWIIIGLFSAVLMGQIICALTSKSSPKNSKGRFSTLWDEAKYDELIAQSAIALKEKPNLQDALYFGAKALHVNGEFEKAKEYYNRLIEAEPTLKRSIKNDLDFLELDINANK